MDNRMQASNQKLWLYKEQEQILYNNAFENRTGKVALGKKKSDPKSKIGSRDALMAKNVHSFLSTYSE